MSEQECALYGDLVRHLRDKCIVKISELDPDHDAAAARTWLDQIIHDWLFTPNEDTLGNAPREIIWRERGGEPNIVPPEHEHDAFFDDCPTCQAMRELGGEWHWHYDDGGASLIAEYDPEGTDVYYGIESDAVARWKQENPDWKQEMQDEAARLIQQEQDRDSAEADLYKLFGLDTDTDDPDEN